MENCRVLLSTDRPLSSATGSPRPVRRIREEGIERIEMVARAEEIGGTIANETGVGREKETEVSTIGTDRWVPCLLELGRS